MSRFVRRAYYFVVGINAFMFLIVMIAPFGGITLIISTVKDGLYRKELFECFAGLFPFGVYYVINQGIAIINFTSMFLCIGSLAWRWIGTQKRYRLGIYSGVIPLILLFLGMMLHLFGC